MPVYAYMQALFSYEEGLSDQAFFERGKRLNIVLGGSLLIALYVLFRSSLSLIPRLVLWSITTFTVFMFRAAYFQVELLFYFLFFAAFLLMVRTLEKPRWGISVLTGATLGATYLSKAAVLPALLLFLGISIVGTAFDAYARIMDDRDFGRRYLVRRLGHPAVIVVSFLAITAPYLLTSKEVFGSYFFSVHNFYMWYDSWGEATVSTPAFGTQDVWQNAPAELIPGPAKYLREHSAYEVLRRPWRGVSHLFRTASSSYGYLKYVGFYLAMLGVASMVRFRQAAKSFRIQPRVPIFVTTFIAAYVLLYAWYTPIAPGIRLVLGLFLPLMWSLFRLFESEYFRLPVFRLKGHDVSWLNATHSVVGMLLIVDLWLFLWPSLLQVYAGN